MMEAAYVTLSSSIGMVHASGGAAAPRTGNRHGGMSLAPYNTYPAADGYIAILANNDTHWRALVTALGRPELADDPRCATNKARVANMDVVDDMVAALTRPLTRAEVFARMVAARVPSAPVRELPEVLTDPHLRARGTLRDYEHPQYGAMTAMASALRFDGEASIPARPSVPLGTDNHAVLAERLGLGAAELAELERDGVI